MPKNKKNWIKIGSEMAKLANYLPNQFHEKES